MIRRRFFATAAAWIASFFFKPPPVLAVAVSLRCEYWCSICGAISDFADTRKQTHINTDHRRELHRLFESPVWRESVRGMSYDMQMRRWAEITGDADVYRNVIASEPSLLRMMRGMDRQGLEPHP